MGRDVARPQGRAWRFDHDAQLVGEVGAPFIPHRRGDGVDAGLDQFHLAHGADQRDHDLGDDGIALAAGIDRGLEDRAGLHVVDLGHGDAQTNAAHAQHRVEFRQGLDPAGHVRQGHVHRFGQFAQPLAVMGQEFVQRRVEQADRHRQTGHDLEEAREILALHGQDARQRQPPVVGAVGKDHLAHGWQALAVKEHVLGPAEADALRLEPAGDQRILGGVGIGAHADPARLVGPGQKLGEIVVQRRGQQGGGARKNLARAAVDGDLVALAQFAAARDEGAVAKVDADAVRAHDAGQAEAARDHGGMAGRAAAFGQHAHRGMHATNILGDGLAAHQDAGLAARIGGLGGGGGQHDPACRGAGAGIDAARDQVAGRARIDLMMQQIGQRAGFDPHQRLFGRDHAVAGQADRDPHARARTARQTRRVDDRDMAIRHDEFDQHLLAQPLAGGDAEADQVGKGLGRDILERGAAFVARQIQRLGPGADRRAVALPAEAAGDAGRAGHRIGELDRARTAQTRPEAQGHLLDDQPEGGIGGRTLGLTQKPRGRPVPGPRHRAQDLGQLARGVLGEGLVHFGFKGGKGAGQGAVALVMEHVGVKPRDVDRVGLHEGQIDRIGIGAADPRRQVGMKRVVDAHVQNRPRPAPFGHDRRGAHADQTAAALEDLAQILDRQGAACGDGADRLAGQRETARDRQVHPDQALQAFRPPSVARAQDPRGGGDQGGLGCDARVHGPAV